VADEAVAPSAPPDAPAPVAREHRVDAIDTLRGVAIMGILVVNIVTFAWPSSAMSVPGMLGGGAWNSGAFAAIDVLFMGKFMFLFAMLFGASIYFFDRKTRREGGRSSVGDGTLLWLRRQGWLLGFGLLHALLLWYGDILAPYAVVGLGVVWWLRRLHPSTQIALAFTLHVIGTLLLIAVFWVLADRFTGDAAEANTQTEIRAHTGGYLDLLFFRVVMTAGFWIILGPIFALQIGGIMLGGIALSRLGILTGERPAGWYAKAAAVLVPGGLISSIAVYTGLPGVIGDGKAAYVWDGMAQFVGIPLGLGYAAAVFFAVKAGLLRVVTRAVANVGRMALTNYLTQSVLCAVIFYGWGLGNYAQVDYPGLLFVTIGIWAVNFTLSAAWLSVFRMGPAEWVWRCLTYWKLQPLLKAA